MNRATREAYDNYEFGRDSWMPEGVLLAEEETNETVLPPGIIEAIRRRAAGQTPTQPAPQVPSKASQKAATASFSPRSSQLGVKAPGASGAVPSRTAGQSLVEEGLPSTVEWLYRSLALLGAVTGYILEGALETVAIGLLLPSNSLGNLIGLGISLASAVFLTVIFNSLQSIWRNALNQDGKIWLAGFFGYTPPCILVFLAFVKVNNFRLGVIPGLGSSGLPAWIQVLMVLGQVALVLMLTVILVLIPEPSVEYFFTGRWRVFGKRQV